MSKYLVMAGEPYCRMAVDPTFVSDPTTWITYTGVYQDPTNLEPGIGLSIHWKDERLWLTGEGADEPVRPVHHATFLSSIGMIEFVMADDGSVSALILGKATRYHRVTESARDMRDVPTFV